MCFSANASFGSAAVLSLIGVVTMRKTSTSTQLALGCFPFIFALQQLSEGFVWLSFTSLSTAGWQSIPIYSFLVFSHVVWPIWIPLSIFLLEKRNDRKIMLYVMVGIGLILSIYHVFCLVFYSVTTQINGHHLQYVIDHPKALLLPGNVLYGMATIIPAFISSVRRMWWLGFFIIISYLGTYLFYQAYVISVWCFFATLMSGIVYLILVKLQGVSAFAGEITTVKREVLSDDSTGGL